VWEFVEYSTADVGVEVYLSTYSMADVGVEVLFVVDLVIEILMDAGNRRCPVL